MAELSPTAQAVLHAYCDSGIDDAVTAATILRAIALYCKRDKSILLSIAEELEAQQTDPLN